MQSANLMIQTVSTDIKVISTYLQTSHESTVHPRNLSELSSLVKNKLEQNLVSRDNKINCREWLQNKGMNIQPLLEYITSRKRRQKDESKNQQKQEIMGIPVLQPTLFNHEEYSQKVAQYASAHILKYVQSNRAIKKRYFRNAMQRLHCNFQDFPSSALPSSILSFSRRNFEKKNVYIKTVKKMLDFENEYKNKRQIYERSDFEQTDKIAKMFFENVSHKIWSILYRQVKNIDFSARKQTIMTQILVNSLEMVEEQFSQELPLNKQVINYYLQQQYLSRIDRNGEYEFDHEHGSIWGKIFLFFRAGRFKEVHNLLQNVPQKDLAKIIMQNYESIRKKMPKKVIIDPFLRKNTKDIFREQILYAIGGQKKYSSQLLADVTTLDCVWVLLRNTGIYYQTDSEIFEEMKFQMSKFYQQNHQERQYIYNAAYLGDYDSILKMTQNEILDKDDLLHLLIVMQRYPNLIIQKQLISQRLAQMAVSYIVELAEQKREELIYYILVLPQERIIQDASSIIAAYKLYLNFDWQQLKKYMNDNVFQKLVSETSKKFVISTLNYLQTAISLSKLINEKETSLNLLTQMFVIHYQEKKIYDQQDVVRAQNFYNALIREQIELGKNYFRLLELFESLHTLAKASSSRNYKSIENIAKKTSLIFGQNIDYYNSKMLEKLMEMSGLDVYFIFLSNMSRAVDYIYNSQIETELKQFNYLLFKTANTVFNNEKYKVASLNQGIIKIVSQLGEKIMESAVQECKGYF